MGHITIPIVSLSEIKLTESEGALYRVLLGHMGDKGYVTQSIEELAEDSKLSVKAVKHILSKLKTRQIIKKIDLYNGYTKIYPLYKFGTTSNGSPFLITDFDKPIDYEQLYKLYPELQTLTGAEQQ